jgi:hypothetical protein
LASDFDRHARVGVRHFVRGRKIGESAIMLMPFRVVRGMRREVIRAPMSLRPNSPNLLSAPPEKLLLERIDPVSQHRSPHR